MVKRPDRVNYKHCYKLKKIMMYSKKIGDEVYVYRNGILIYKKWLKQNNSVVFNNPPNWKHDKTISKEQNLEDKDKALHIGVVTKRLNWMVEEMDKAKPFSQYYNNLNQRHSRLLEAKKILDKEGLWL